MDTKEAERLARKTAVILAKVYKDGFEKGLKRGRKEKMAVGVRVEEKEFVLRLIQKCPQLKPVEVRGALWAAFKMQEGDAKKLLAEMKDDGLIRLGRFESSKRIKSWDVLVETESDS